MYGIICTFQCVCWADIDFTFECFHVSEFKPREKTGASLQTDRTKFPSGGEHILKRYTSSALIIFTYLWNSLWTNNSQSRAFCFHSARHCIEKLHSSCVRCTKLQLGTKQLSQRYDYILHQPLEIGGFVHLKLLFTSQRNTASDTFSHVMSLDTELGLYKKQITT